MDISTTQYRVRYTTGVGYTLTRTRDNTTILITVSDYAKSKILSCTESRFNIDAGMAMVNAKWPTENCPTCGKER